MVSLGTEVGLGPGDIVLDGDPFLLQTGDQQPPLSGPCLLSSISASAKLLCEDCVETVRWTCGWQGKGTMRTYWLVDTRDWLVDRCVPDSQQATADNSRSSVTS